MDLQVGGYHFLLNKNDIESIILRIYFSIPGRLQYLNERHLVHSRFLLQTLLVPIAERLQLTRGKRNETVALVLDCGGETAAINDGSIFGPVQESNIPLLVGKDYGLHQ